MEVTDFWEKRAAQKELSDEQVTHRDIWQRWLEIQNISIYLRSSDRVLDVGCGSGYSTRIFAPSVREIVGIDYSETMIVRAQEETERQGFPPEKIRFLHGDVMHLSPSSAGYFDTIISERCLINLPSFEEQKKAIGNIASVLNINGRFIFVEGSADGRIQLNILRKKMGLPEMPKVWHNVDFHEAETLRYLEEHFTLEDRKYFGMYDFVSRVIHPLLVAPEEPKYDSRINEIGAKISLEVGGFEYLSRVLFLVLRKR